MTPDELSADREGRLLSDLDEATKEKAPFVVVYASDLRAILKAYQKQRRALEAASTVVPVGVRERVLDELDKAWLHGQRRTSWRRDESADAIMAACQPVVPVGVSEEQRQRVAEIVEAAIERHAPANSIRHTLDDANAIIAALRPTDTGANHD